MSPIFTVLCLVSIASIAESKFLDSWPDLIGLLQPKDPNCGYGILDSCSSQCQATCVNGYSVFKADCIEGCVEGCKCLDNNVFDESTGKCITLKQCQKSAENDLKKAKENKEE